MVRKIIRIDRALCNGCGACAAACHEGAIAILDGVAVLTHEDYCDGLGDCLPACPTGAITFEEREISACDAAAADSEAAVFTAKSKPQGSAAKSCPGHRTQGGRHAAGCPGSAAKVMWREPAAHDGGGGLQHPSQLMQWPCQIKLIPVRAPYFDGADLLIAADCTAYAYADFHADFMKNRITLIGCPKLDDGDYAEKLTQIIAENEIRSVMVLRMEVPCCGGLEHAVKRAIAASGKCLPWQVVTVTTDGKILE